MATRDPTDAFVTQRYACDVGLVDALFACERLQAERKEWQSKATQSFQNKRTRSLRARSKSLGASQGRTRKPSMSAQANAFDFLAERTLLGNQARPPTIHVRGPGSMKSHGRSSSTGGQTRSSMTLRKPLACILYGQLAFNCDLPALRWW